MPRAEEAQGPRVERRGGWAAAAVPPLDGRRVSLGREAMWKRSLVVSAPGKVILHGEHAVVHGKVGPRSPRRAPTTCGVLAGLCSAPQGAGKAGLWRSASRGRRRAFSYCSLFI